MRLASGPKTRRVEKDDRGGNEEQHRPAPGVALEVGVGDQEVGGDRDRRGRRNRLFVGDARERRASRDPRPLGEEDPAEHVEDAARDVAGEQGLPPGDLGPAHADPVAEEAEDQIPAEGAERVVDQQHDERRDQPEDVEVDPFVLDFRPIVDDRQDQEAEDHDRQPELDREPDPLAARRAGAEPGPGFADPMKYWAPFLHAASHHRERRGCTAAGPAARMAGWASSTCWRASGSGSPPRPAGGGRQR